MPNDILDLARNPDFFKMSEEGQLETIRRMNSDFGTMSLDAQKIILGKLATVRQAEDINPTPPAKTFDERMIEQAPRVLGGTAAGLGIMATGGTALIPAVGAVALGAGAGELARQGGLALSSSPEAPETPEQAVGRATSAGIEQGSLELGGQIVFRGIGRVLGAFSSKLKPEASKIISAFKDRIKPILTPAEATDSRVLDIMENVGDYSIFGGGKFAEFRLNRDKVLDEIADDLIDQYGNRLTPEEFGELFVKAVNNKQETVKPVVKALYNRVKALAGGHKIMEISTERKMISPILDATGVPLERIVTDISESKVPDVIVPTSSLKSFATPLKEVGKEINHIERLNAGDDLVDTVLEMPDHLSFDAAVELRSRLLSRVQELNVINKNAPAVGKAKKMIELIDSAVEESLRNLKPTVLPGGVDYQSVDALAAWRLANSFYKDTQERFNNKLVRAMIKRADDTRMGPETIGKMFFKPGNVTGIDQLRTILPASDFERVKGMFIQTLFEKASDQEGKILGNRVLSLMEGKPNSYGLPMLQKMFSDTEIESIRTFATAAKLSQEKQAGGLGSMFIQLSQAGALVKVAQVLGSGAAFGTGRFEEGTAILITPAILSRLILNPKIAKLLMDGIKLPTRSPEAAGIMTRLTAAILRAHAGPDGHNKFDIKARPGGKSAIVPKIVPPPDVPINEARSVMNSPNVEPPLNFGTGFN